jgi:hypothetical protein
MFEIPGLQPFSRLSLNGQYLALTVPKCLPGHGYSLLAVAFDSGPVGLGLESIPTAGPRASTRYSSRRSRSPIVTNSLEAIP